MRLVVNGSVGSRHVESFHKVPQIGRGLNRSQLDPSIKAELDPEAPIPNIKCNDILKALM